MTSIQHPNYPNPTIQEAICEIGFRLPEGETWKPEWFGEFFKEVQHEFSTFEPVNPGVQLSFDKVAPQIARPSQVMRYRNPSRPSVIQLSNLSIVINSLPVYPGWDLFRKDIENAWEILKKVVKPNSVPRIGLRYINRIERSNPNESLGVWLKATPYIPEALLKSHTGFASILQTRIDASNMVNVSIGEFVSPHESPPAFIFDIDRIIDQEISIETPPLLELIDALHASVREIFDSARTNKLEMLLKGEIR